ncbi:hypothetical protein [Streptomyces sp. NPDC050534]|uniref:hypothetical protein n=1 Tax=Streptomyces sp. NPDC050534 TaxID=3365625 RepID=UPI0037AD383F
MPPTPSERPPLRSADELNAAIRAFWIDGRGHPTVGLTPDQRAEYQRLLAALEALRAVERGGVTTAA